MITCFDFPSTYNIMFYSFAYLQFDYCSVRTQKDMNVWAERGEMNVSSSAISAILVQMSARLFFFLVFIFF